ncbi:6-bladed beta-propeller [Paramuribaculum intestinale]|uniref:6-bladed beta-propeller n=1 Tax=Paramuribaculum intestinale TaxID=2094151 RepID=UPI000D1E8C62|nr:6-bladed beta-propeller [Paramuribaculum intestinale]PWB10312.1 6-bladed beta-propeller [Paramuribaculum intestinale]WLT41220.1 6-bladed beta-propeller [Paramuribaculum intestinale]
MHSHLTAIKLIAGATMALAAGCTASSQSDNTEILQIDMLADIDRPDFDETSLKDVRYALLDTATEALLGEYAQIQGVIGDTVIVHDMTAMGDNSRLLLFDANDGHLIRSIRHIGQGPGEYRWIGGVVTIPERSEIILLSDKAHRYTTDDRYIESYSMSSKHGGALPIGSAERGIHETDAFDGDLHIYQYDDRMTPVDTLVINNYEPRWISIAFNQSDKESLINIVDTVYSLVPGEMQPVAVLSRGVKALTPEVENKVYIGRTDYEQAERERQGYIEFLRFINDGPRFTVTYAYGGRNYFDTYSHKSGKLIARRSFSDSDEDAGLLIPHDGRTMHITNYPFISNGRYYSIVSEDETLGSDGEPSEELNRALISWSVEGE